MCCTVCGKRRTARARILTDLSQLRVSPRQTHKSCTELDARPLIVPCVTHHSDSDISLSPVSPHLSRYDDGQQRADITRHLPRTHRPLVSVDSARRLCAWAHCACGLCGRGGCGWVRGRCAGLTGCCPVERIGDLPTDVPAEETVTRFQRTRELSAR